MMWDWGRLTLKYVGYSSDAHSHQGIKAEAIGDAIIA